jgi:hypothetical protein
MNRIFVLIALVFRWREAFPRLVWRALFPPLQLDAIAEGVANLHENIILGTIPMHNASAVQEQVTFEPVAVPETITGAERWK